MNQPRLSASELAAVVTDETGTMTNCYDDVTATFEPGAPPTRKSSGRPSLDMVLAAELVRVADLGGQWAKIATWPRSQTAGAAANRLRKRRPDFEFTSRTLPDGTGAVWARKP